MLPYSRAMSAPARAASGDEGSDRRQQRSERPRGTKKHKLLLGLAVVAAVAGLLGWADLTRDGGSPSCASQLASERRVQMGTDATLPAPGDVAPNGEVPLAVDQRAEVREGGAGVGLAFGDDRTPMVRRQAFLMPKGVDLKKVAVTVPFGDAAQADERPLPAGHVRADVVGRGPGRLVSVAVCVNPQLPDELLGGTYTAGALVGAGEVLAPMSLEVTVQDDRGWLVALAALVGVAAGLFIKLYSDMATDGLPDELLETSGAPACSWRSAPALPPASTPS